MRKPLILSLIIFTALLVVVSDAFAIGKRVIVVFSETSSPAERRAIVASSGATIVKELSIVPAVVVNLPEQASEKAREAILKHALVVRIEDDLIVNAVAAGGKKPPTPPPAETLPWGVDRIDADSSWINSRGIGVKVAVLDTGIDVAHSDLTANLAGGTNIISPTKLYNDDNGHGTHVAGIIAAVDNEIGVIGVANKASLYGVKVLDRRGSGWLSDIIAGLEWSINNRMDVVNMSLSTASYSQVFHDAVTAVYNAGVVQVAASGNEGGPVGYPAAFPEVIAVSATDILDAVTSWSNYGPEIDIAAPGKDIKSTYKGNTYKTLSGTSMAAPHVAGVAVLILENRPAYTPADVLNAIISTADDLGFSSNQQGAGLVDAEEAVLVTE